MDERTDGWFRVNQSSVCLSWFVKNDACCLCVWRCISFSKDISKDKVCELEKVRLACNVLLQYTQNIE